MDYIESYIALYPGFATALTPWHSPIPAPTIIADMIKAGEITGVGPMAAVAGAIAQYVGKGLLAHSDEVIVEILDRTLPDEALALKAAQKNVHKYNGLEWNDFRKKLSGFLARRGFSYNIISPIVDQVWNELDPQGKSGGESLKEVIE